MEMPFPDYQQLMRTWLDIASKMASAGATGASESIPSDGTKQMRDMYFQTLSQYTDQYMRSPQFLEMMKQSTDTAVALRQQTNDFLAQAHHAVGSLARPDVDSLLMAIRRCETRVLDKLDELSTRLNDLESAVKAVPVANGKRLRKSQ